MSNPQKITAEALKAVPSMEKRRGLPYHRHGLIFMRRVILNSINISKNSSHFSG